MIGAAYVDGLIPELALGVAHDRAYGGGLDGRRAATSNSRRRGASRPRGSAGRCGDNWRNACARCIRAPGRRRSGHGGRWGYYAAVALTAAGLSADLLWGRWTRAAVTGLVVDLGDRFEPDALKAALAQPGRS